jgi:hypothetical protein
MSRNSPEECIGPFSTRLRETALRTVIDSSLAIGWLLILGIAALYSLAVGTLEVPSDVFLVNYRQFGSCY